MLTRYSLVNTTRESGTKKMYFYRKYVLLGITVNDLTFFVYTPYVSTHKAHCLRWLWSFTISKHRHIWEKSLYPQFNWYYDPRHQLNYSCSASWMTCLLVSTFMFPTGVCISTRFMLTLSWPAGHICPTYKESFQVRWDKSIQLFLVLELRVIYKHLLALTL